MVITIVLGAISGIIGFIPLIIGLRLTKHVTTTSNFSHMSILILCLVVSFVLLFVFAVLCINFARDVALPFVLAEAVGLSVTAIAFGVKRMLRKEPQE